ncbi:hypothetical protein N7516_010498 [Penicillium verrucosum]|uniref:uncharacterized protein n=1 Tax=Penicillium verrucosum TaxID=60171 RepID=UPI0025455DD9|nr:uncharacterized protein N7516_010498 [Penicillium verrucosum]KAJ5922795.1 hypothetical protein N7516_010498 [Penicillium verrucosum]
MRWDTLSTTVPGFCLDLRPGAGVRANICIRIAKPTDHTSKRTWYQPTCRFQGHPTSGGGTKYDAVSQQDKAKQKAILDVNTLGPVRLFQATLSLSPSEVIICSFHPGQQSDGNDCSDRRFSLKIPPCGLARRPRTTLHYLGYVPWCEDKGWKAARAAGFPGAFIEVEDNMNVIITKIDGLAKGNGAGEFWNIDGTTIGW